MAIQFVGTALQEAAKLQIENGKPLRLYLEGKGCDGFYYGVCLDTQTVDDQVYTQDYEGTAVQLLVDPDTYSYVENASIAWIDDERGKGFLVDNPDHKRYRGKFFKRKSFQEQIQEKTKEKKISP